MSYHFYDRMPSIEGELGKETVWFGKSFKILSHFFFFFFKFPPHFSSSLGVTIILTVLHSDWLFIWPRQGSREYHL